MGRIEKALEEALKKKQAEHSAPAGLLSENAPSGDASARPCAVADNALLVTINAPHSVIAEEFRKLKSAVVSMTKQSGFQNAILVTSALGGEGKSFTALNLAVSIAEEYDHSVLLVDADLRKPSLNGYLGFDMGQGRADCLTDNVDLGSVIIRTGISKLSLLPAGKSVKNPVELLSSLRMKELFFEMKHRYADRYLIFDTPPLLPFAETQSLCSYMDGIILVVRQEMTPIQSIRDSLALLQDKQLLGIVYNGVNPQSLNSRYNYYYYNRYRYQAK